MKIAVVLLFATVALSAAPGTQTFNGTITDDVCAKGDHSHMRMGADDAECAAACVSAHGAAYVLYNGKTFYKLSGPEAPEKFAGQKVKVTGVLDKKSQTIRVESIARAK